MKFKTLVKFIVLTHLFVNTIPSTSGATLVVNPENIAITAPLNYIFTNPANAMQDLTHIASNHNSLNDAVRAAFNNRITNMPDLPATGAISITDVNTAVYSAIENVSKQMLKQLSEILSPDETTAKNAMKSLNPTLIEVDAKSAFDAFQNVRTTPGQVLTDGTEPLLPLTSTAGEPDPNLIVVPLPTTPGLKNCTTALGDSPILDDLIAVIQNVYYNKIKLENLTKHVRNTHIGERAISGDADKTRFHAKNVHAAMHYIRFVLNLILPENKIIKVVQLYPGNDKKTGRLPTLKNNIVYIEHKPNYHHNKITAKRDIIIHYQFPYMIGEGMLRIRQKMERLNIILSNYNNTSHSIVAWHFKSAYPVIG